ncbi:MAG: FHA domain-containing protein [Anaerolineales bacterium]|nr:FHA domain-containing protein [Anaerolineales bacterium]
MVTCRVCSKQEFEGTLFCGECGSQLVHTSDSNVDTFIYPSQARGLEIDISNTIPEKLLENKAFILYYADAEEAINIPDQEEFTIGRFVDGQVITPDVDLDLYDGFEKGVSRLHATIRISPDKSKIFVIDLGSANGSSVNGYEIPANSEVPLNHGDVLSLGKFSLKVILPKEMK